MAEKEKDEDCGCGSNPLCKCVDGVKTFPPIPPNG